jgi:hypothetical protein
LLEQNQHQIDWTYLSYNKNPNAIHLMERNLDDLCWTWIRQCDTMIDLLQRNQNRIYWYWISCNPAIFEKKIDYQFLKQRMEIIRQELMIKCMHPTRLEKWLLMGGDIDDF